MRFAFDFGGLMIATEVALLVIFRLQLPQDSGRIALTLFVAVPLPAALVAGFRSARDLATLWPLSVVFTLALSVTAGTAAGLLAPLIIRPLAGYAAGVVATAIRSGDED